MSREQLFHCLAELALCGGGAAGMFQILPRDSPCELYAYNTVHLRMLLDLLHTAITFHHFFTVSL